MGGRGTCLPSTKTWNYECSSRTIQQHWAPNSSSYNCLCKLSCLMLQAGRCPPSRCSCIRAQCTCRKKTCASEQRCKSGTPACQCWRDGSSDGNTPPVIDAERLGRRSGPISANESSYKPPLGASFSPAGQSGPSWVTGREAPVSGERRTRDHPGHLLDSDAWGLS